MLGRTMATRKIQMLRFTTGSAGYQVTRWIGRDGAPRWGSVAQASLPVGTTGILPVEAADSTGETPIGPTGTMPVLPNRPSAILPFFRRRYLRVAREDAVVSAPQPAGLAKSYRLFWYLSE